jgi:hypothetical protein
MASALKDISDALVPGLYPGWRFTPDYTTDTVWIEGPQGYVSRISRKQLEDSGAGLDGVLEFILHKDARMKREAALQVPLYEQMRKQAETATEQALEAEYREMCAKGYGATSVDPTTMLLNQEYQGFVGVRENILRTAEALGIPRAEMEKMLYQPDEGTRALRAQQRAVLQELNMGQDTTEVPVHKPWNGVREVDLD